ncbi:MAG: DNA starvation/stationary phase protection protein [Deltaproteobacteria bacterium]|nr:DNA starvation/stationary phase protection protein [Deltaproteobacteria bacterium]
MEINIGIAAGTREKIAQDLSHLLADTFSLYLKTHYYHWNVTGPHFKTLHEMFEGQYNELWEAVDLIAERMRALGAEAPGSYNAYAQATHIKEAHKVPHADTMVQDLAEGHETIARNARKMFETVSKAHDEVTADMLTGRMTVHEKTAWMLRSLLD